MWRQAGIGERVPLVLGGCAAVLLTVTAATAEPNAIAVLSSLHNLEYAEAACSHLRSIADIKDIIEPQWVIGTAEEIAKTQRRSDWRRLSAGAGTKGPRLHDWCYLELADLEGEESNHHSQVLWTRGLLIRRNIANGDLAYFTTWCPAGTSIETLVSVEGHRWAIEDSFETAKNEFGLDHNEFQIVAWLASSRLARHARICHDGCHPTSGQQAGAQKNQVQRDAKTSHLIRWSIQEIRRIAHRLAQKRIQPADIIAWSLWRRAHQAVAQKPHIKQKSQL